MTCAEIPEILARTRNGCQEVARRYPNCRCEAETVCPTYSPGVILGGEQLIRFVLREWWDEDTGQAVPAAFAHAAQKGMSTTRTAHCTQVERAEQERSRADYRSNNKDYVGYVSAMAESIRELRYEGRQAFAVYDTALDQSGTGRAHADVCQSIFQPGTKAIELRRTLQKLFNRSGLRSAASPV